MVSLVKHDLEFILKQIKIAEAHAAGGDLATLVAQAGGFDVTADGVPTQAHLLPYGLRTVDGSYNNLVPGREMWGAADQPFPGLFDPTYINENDGDSMDFGPGGVYTNNDYGNAGPLPGNVPGAGSGTVIDADPRIISNLIVDQSLANPAAIMTALQHAGIPSAQLAPALTAISNAWSAYSASPKAEANLTALHQAVAVYGIEMDGVSVVLPNVAPDEGLSSPFNGWMTIFGQFFDHGLDLVAKGGNGTVYVPLQPDDPLYVEGSRTNFMALTRVTVNPGLDGRLGTADDVAAPTNLTTPWVDQNQTYGSTASKQIFMREYTTGPEGTPIATGLLLEGSKGGLATWLDIKTQARNMLGIELTDADVGKIPLLVSDEYGNFIPGANGYPQLVVGLGPDGKLGTADDLLREGDPAAPVSTAGAILTGHAFLDDIAHTAVPVFGAGGVLVADADDIAGNAVPTDVRGNNTQYDNEMLDAHYIAGDGRANENIALTAVHHVFHSEHNRLVEHTKDVVLASGDLAFLNEWLLVDVGSVPTDQAAIDALVWDGERLFQAGRFTTEMEYQHLVFEEFGRMMQPDIDAFVFEPSVDINPNIAAEFAHVVYRFGHSMLREDIARISIDENGNPVQDDIGLIQGFLNPLEFANAEDADAAAGAIIRGMSRQVGNEIDEFVTGALRNNLLGLPLDLATINLARGRDVGTPSLNAAREKFFNATQDTQLKPYESWTDYALNLKNPASIVNFIAAYGTHPLVAAETTLEGKRAAAVAIVFGTPQIVYGDPAIPTDDRLIQSPLDRLDFLNSTGTWASAESGLNTVDFWIGGLAEKKMAFGGMLGSSFSFVFEMTMENLQDADRFYYLSRTQGLNLLNQLENNTFAELAMRNTDLGDPDSTVVPGNLFSAFEMPILEMDPTKQLGADPTQDDPTLQVITQLVERRDASGVLIGPNDTTTVAGYIRVNSNEHFVIGGTENNDTIVSGGGDDAIWGKGGDDNIEAGYGVDKVFGGEGDDIITNAGTDIGEADFLHGNEGNDVIHAGNGLALIFGNEGQDFIVTGPDGKEAFGGTGNDFILGGSGGDFLLGNEGDDWLEGGDRFDTLAGENSELMFNSTIIGHDVLNGGTGDTDYDGESGDDIMFQNLGIQRSNGMAGFDWAIHKGDSVAANSDLGIPLFANQEAFILRDRFDLVEGLSGWKHDDVLTGRVAAVNTRAEVTGTAAIPGADAPLDSYSNALLDKNVQLIAGLDQLVAHLARTSITVAGKTELIVMDTADASDILLGGGGDDVIKGLAGNDIIDGDRWLNVRIAIHQNRDGTGPVIASADGMTAKIYQVVNGVVTENLYNPAGVQNFQGMTLQQSMFDRTLNPGQLKIVREIVDGNEAGDIDTAVYTDVVTNYTFTRNADGSVTVNHSGFVDGAVGNVEGAGEKPVSDGIDRLFNIERLRFSNGAGGTVEFDIDQLINEPATGLPVISDLTPTEGQALTVDTSSIADVNGVGSFAYQWQQSLDGVVWTNIAGATGATFTPVNLPGDQFGPQAGQRLQVIVSFTDGAGNAETVTSAATGVVGVDWDGQTGFLQGDTFNGTAGDDIADGTIFGDTLNGNGGNDVLRGSGANDVITGGEGNDTIEGGGNSILGGGDTASFTGAAFNYNFALNGGNLVVTDNVGTDGSDTMNGVEFLRFAGSNYTLVNGSDAAQTVSGANNRADVVLGHGGNDTLNGNSGNDVLVGGAGNDTVNGGDGNDTIIQTGGTDGRDLVNGGVGVDTYQINGSAGAETFTIYSRAAAIAAITGLTLNVNTEIVVARNGAVVAELDNIEEIRVNTLQVTAPGGSAGGVDAGDTIEVVGNFLGTSLNFSTITIDGTASDDTVNISALASAHRIVFRSNGGNDTIIGTLRANDVIELPPGKTLAGYTLSDNDDGTTTIECDEHKITYLGSGTPTIREATITAVPAEETAQIEPDTTPPVRTDVIPAPVVPPVADLNVWGGRAHDRLNGDLGHDRLHGGAGNDRLHGGGGDDRLNGGSGNDRLSGGTGIDKMWGGKGNDVYEVDHAKDRVFEFARQGSDTVSSSVSYKLGAHVEKLVLTGQANLSGTGNGLDNVLTGNAGDNALKGGSGHDVLKGQGGDDRLYGGAGDDRLSGGSGQDILNGGSGNDRLAGGGGADVFVFHKNGGRDTVTDFRDGEDRIDVRGLAGVENLSDLHRVQIGADTAITHGDDILVLKGVTASDLDQSDFIF